MKLLLNGSDNTWVYNGGIVNCRITTRLSTIISLVAGDYLQIQTLQTAGTIDVQGNDIADNITLFGVQYLGA